MLSITAAGGTPVYPLLPTRAFQAALDRLYAAGEMNELVAVADSNTLDPWPVPQPIRPVQPAVGKLYWPGFGAGRFAHAVYAMDQHSVERLKLDLGGSTNRVTVAFTDGPDVTAPPEEAREFIMYVVGIRPISRTTTEIPDPTQPVSGDLDGYLVTLVDLRYYWQFCAGVDYAAGGTWTGLFAAFGTALGATVTAGTPNSAYLTPGDGWTAAKTVGAPTVHLFDAAAALVNGRVVVDPATEAVSVLYPSAGRTALAAWDTDADPPRRVAGGMTDPDINALAVPANVVCNFPDTDATATGVVSGAVTGGQLIYCADATGTDGAQRTALATRVAQDWGSLQDVPLDAVYQGFTVPPAGSLHWVGHLELLHTAYSGITVLRRPPLNYPQVVRRRESRAATVWLARLTTLGEGGKWKYYRLTLDGSGAYIDDGAEAADYTAVPSTIDGTNLCNPVAGLRVVMWESQQAGFQEFLPVGYTDATHPGLVSIADQTVGDGIKTFQKQVTVNSTTPSGTYTPFVVNADPDGSTASTPLLVTQDSDYTYVSLAASGAADVWGGVVTIGSGGWLGGVIDDPDQVAAGVPGPGSIELVTPFVQMVLGNAVNGGGVGSEEIYDAIALDTAGGGSAYTTIIGADGLDAVFKPGDNGHGSAAIGFANVDLTGKFYQNVGNNFIVRNGNLLASNYVYAQNGFAANDDPDNANLPHYGGPPIEYGVYFNSNNSAYPEPPPTPNETFYLLAWVDAGTGDPDDNYRESLLLKVTGGIVTLAGRGGIPPGYPPAP